MYNRLYEYLTKNSILYKIQFGFEKAHSKSHTILELINEITNAFEKNMYTLGVFVDLSKAFDTVNNDILLSKLKHYRINENVEFFSINFFSGKP